MSLPEGVGYSQFGEDRVIVDLFPPDFRGHAIDIGASDGVVRSNTWAIEQMGWTVACVEANPLYTEMLQLRRKIVRMAAVADYEGWSEFTTFELRPGCWEACSALKPVEAAVEAHKHIISREYKFKVEVITLDRLLEDLAFPALDFLSVDVEGGEMAVLRGFDVARWKPKVIVLENWLGEANQEQHDFLEPFGYRLLTRLGVNDIYGT
jgi:FkbM family methyltransferase